MNPGSHVARIQRGAAVLATRTVALTAGAAEAVKIELAVKSADLTVHPPAESPIVTAPAAGPTPVDRGTGRSWLRSPWLWSGVAAVAAASAGGAYLLTRPSGVVIK
jgi:hypothetical protein